MIRLQRPALSVLANRRFDAVVTGGGVYGACFAYEMASRGLQVLLVEKSDFGAAASANSLRIVHGGLRYLQKFDFARARASAMERSTLLRIFPGLITPLLCAVPTGPGLRRGRTAFGAGLLLNEVISADRNRGLGCRQRLPAGGVARRKRLKDWCQSLDVQPSAGTAFWYDAFMEDPERLVLSYVAAAADHGAQVINHASVDDYQSVKGKLVGATVTDQLSGRQVAIHADIAVDCRSGWLELESPVADAFRRRQQLFYVRGVNLILDRELCTCAIGFTSPSARDTRRFLFMVPKDGRTMVGTWYLPVTGGIERAATTAEERGRMLGEVAAAMPAARLSVDDIVGQHVGILPCAGEGYRETEEPQPIEAAHVVSGPQVGGPAGLWFVQGEKWTTARRTVSLVGDAIAGSVGKSLRRSRSARTVLSPGQDDCPEDAIMRAQGAESAVRRMWRRRGCQANDILAMAEAENGPIIESLLAAETAIAVEQEMAMTLADAIRRLGLGQLGPPPSDALELIADSAAQRLGWSSEERQRQIGAVRADPRYLADTDAAATRPEFVE